MCNELHNHTIDTVLINIARTTASKNHGVVNQRYRLCCLTSVQYLRPAIFKHNITNWYSMLDIEKLPCVELVLQIGTH